MKSYSKFQAIWSSVCSAALYRDVRTRWNGIGFSYILLLTTLIVSALIIVGSLVLNDYLFTRDATSSTNQFQRFVQSVAAQVPAMEWRKGQMHLLAENDGSFVPSRDIFLEIGDKKIRLAHIDPEAKASTLTADSSFALLTSDAVLIRKNSGMIESRSWESFGLDDYSIDNELTRMYSELLVNYIEENRFIILSCLAMFLWAVSMLLMFIWRVLQSLVFGGIGMMFCAIMHVTMTYQTAVRLATVALTPAILLDVTMAVKTGKGLPLWLFILIATGYMGFAIRSNRDPQDVLDAPAADNHEPPTT